MRRKMFRMDKTSFLTLHSKIKPLLSKSRSARSARMAKVSSGSHVSSLLHLACTLRWLAGGSPWDICYAFHVSYATLHAKKFKVVAAINQALRHNISFPTTEPELQLLVRNVLLQCSITDSFHRRMDSLKLHQAKDASFQTSLLQLTPSSFHESGL
jgi:hypothetical protein